MICLKMKITGDTSHTTGLTIRYNREGIIVNTKSLKFHIKATMQPTVVLSINGQIARELVEQAFSQNGAPVAIYRLLAL